MIFDRESRVRISTNFDVPQLESLLNGDLLLDLAAHLNMYEAATFAQLMIGQGHCISSIAEFLQRVAAADPDLSIRAVSDGFIFADKMGNHLTLIAEGVGVDKR
ncbi:hypothetical protein QVA66_03665 [Staphylococcus chromogenes]|nr:hypothetical protein [Staphylococcus chromogenes]